MFAADGNWFKLCLQALVYGVSLALVLLLALAAWRMRGVYQWHRGLAATLRRLQKEAKETTGARQQAITIILARCDYLWRTSLPSLAEIGALGTYVRQIAACFHPQAARPELMLTTGRLLLAARQGLQELGAIIRRAGFQRLYRVRIRQLVQAYHWYSRFSHNPVLAWLLRWRSAFFRLTWLRLFAWPDPISWLIFLSQRLALLSLSRYFLVEVYLLAGSLALGAYGEDDTEIPWTENDAALEEFLETLEKAGHSGDAGDDPEIKRIRRDLLGHPAWLQPPQFSRWQTALLAAANRTAARYFPDSPQPLAEAALGPLLERTCAWVDALTDTSKIPLLGRLHGIRVHTLFNMATWSNQHLIQQVGAVARQGWSGYQLARWPRRLYRWMRRKSPGGIALEIGWLLVRRAFLRFVAGYSFDLACRELDKVYRLSSKLPQPTEGRPKRHYPDNEAAPAGSDDWREDGQRPNEARS